MPVAPRAIAAALLAAALLASPAPAPACPNCKEAVASQPEDARRLTQGYSYSIMLMLATPALLLGTGALVVTRAVKKGILPPM